MLLREVVTWEMAPSGISTSGGSVSHHLPGLGARVHLELKMLNLPIPLIFVMLRCHLK